jgi:hypothetical protein
VRHLEAWLAAAGIADGWLFRRISNDGKQVTAEPMSDRAVARVVQQRVAAAGLDPAAYAGHSLRAGFLTAAARAGASIFDMQAGTNGRGFPYAFCDKAGTSRGFRCGRDFPSVAIMHRSSGTQ